MVVTGDRADGCSVWTSDLVTKKEKTDLDLAKQRKGNSWQMSNMNSNHILLAVLSEDDMPPSQGFLVRGSPI